MHGFHRSGKTPQEIVRQSLFLEAEVMRCRQLKQKEDEDDIVAKKRTQNGDDDDDERVLRDLQKQAEVIILKGWDTKVDTERVELILCNLLVARALIFEVVLFPWKHGLTAEPSARAKTNLRVVASLMWIVMRRFRGLPCGV